MFRSHHVKTYLITTQITESSGVPQQTVVGEATKLFQRMKERTQLAYVWFAGHFLHLLLQQLFENVHIREADVAIVSSFFFALSFFFSDVCFLNH